MILKMPSAIGSHAPPEDLILPYRFMVETICEHLSRFLSYPTLRISLSPTAGFGNGGGEGLVI